MPDFARGAEIRRVQDNKTGSLALAVARRRKQNGF